MTALYNEIDAYCSRWLDSLCGRDLIVSGRVDTRSICDLEPTDLVGVVQAHFFAGLGAWSYSLRLAGWPDSVPVWTGSCPCQPFSVAGKGKKFDDERHLWPAWFRLIRECRPPIIFGEQVAGDDGLEWLDLVCADLEAEGYAVAPFDLPAASVGAPHIRQRLYFVAYAVGARFEGLAQRRADRSYEAGGSRRSESARGSEARGLADPRRDGRELGGQAHDNDRGHAFGHDADRRGAPCGVGDADSKGSWRDARADDRAQGASAGARDSAWGERHGPLASGEACIVDGFRAVRARRGAFDATGAVRGFWADADWFYCRDGFWRPAQPGTFPLAARSAGSVGRRRAAGNAICAPLAATFIRCVIDHLSGLQNPSYPVKIRTACEEPNDGQ